MTVRGLNPVETQALYRLYLFALGSHAAVCEALCVPRELVDVAILHLETCEECQVMYRKLDSHEHLGQSLKVPDVLKIIDNPNQVEETEEWDQMVSIKILLAKMGAALALCQALEKHIIAQSSSQPAVN